MYVPFLTLRERYYEISRAFRAHPRRSVTGYYMFSVNLTRDHTDVHRNASHNVHQRALWYVWYQTHTMRQAYNSLGCCLVL